MYSMRSLFKTIFISRNVHWEGPNCYITFNKIVVVVTVVVVGTVVVVVMREIATERNRKTIT